VSIKGDNENKYSLYDPLFKINFIISYVGFNCVMIMVLKKKFLLKIIWRSQKYVSIKGDKLIN